MFNLFKKKTESTYEDYRIKRVMAESELYRKYDFSPFIEWVNTENDAEKLGSAYCVINTWGWPSFMPPLPFESELRKNREVPESYFASIIMGLCKNKAEVLHPGLTQVIWMSGAYRKYDMLNSEQDVKASDTTTAK
jgi:hypothetical protein